MTNTKESMSHTPLISIDSDNALIRVYRNHVNEMISTQPERDAVLNRLYMDATALATAVSYLTGCTFKVKVESENH